MIMPMVTQRKIDYFFTFAKADTKIYSNKGPITYANSSIGKLQDSVKKIFIPENKFCKKPKYNGKLSGSSLPIAATRIMLRMRIK